MGDSAHGAVFVGVLALHQRRVECARRRREASCEPPSQQTSGRHVGSFAGGRHTGVQRTARAARPCRPPRAPSLVGGDYHATRHAADDHLPAARHAIHCRRRDRGGGLPRLHAEPDRACVWGRRGDPRERYALRAPALQQSPARRSVDAPVLHSRSGGVRRADVGGQFDSPGTGAAFGGGRRRAHAMVGYRPARVAARGGTAAAGLGARRRRLIRSNRDIMRGAGPSDGAGVPSRRQPAGASTRLHAGGWHVSGLQFRSPVQ